MPRYKNESFHARLLESSTELRILEAGQTTNVNCWNPTTITAIKAEPRDTSPQPYSMYRSPQELTPSPQPLSPSSACTHNTPSPYNMVTTGTAPTQGNHPLISPNQQYNATNTGGRNAPPLMDVSDYNAFSQQAQQHQYHVNNYGSAGATHWEVKLNPASAAAINNLSNFCNTNTFTMHNLLTHTNAAGNGSGTGWNLTSNHVQQHHLHQQQYQQQQRAQDSVTNNNNGVLANAVLTPTSVNTTNNANSNEHGLSNLLTFDSEQLVRINSEDQQMLRLNSEDLQISNLSIST